MDAAITGAVEWEIAFANRRYGDTKDLGTFLMVLEEEVREAKLAFIKGSRDDALCEVLQVAAVAINAIQQHGLVEREGVR